TLLPECLEDWICEDNPVRVIGAFVEELDLAELKFCGVDPEATGRPAYHPSVMLKLYIYGYISIGFSRAAGLSAKAGATLRACGSPAGLSVITKRLPISARITGLRSVGFASSSSRFAGRWACCRKRVLRSTGANSKRSTTAIRTLPAQRSSAALRRSIRVWRG